MSLLSRNIDRRPRTAMDVVSTTTLAAVAALLAAGSASSPAAEFYYQPVVSLSTAYTTNVLLEPGQNAGTEGYFADASTTIGIATPNSDTMLQPRLLYNYYPSVSGLNRLEGFLTLNNRYSWQRDRFNITGFFDHRDDVNAEQPGATDNTATPGIGTTTPSTGHVATGVTRNWLVLDPSFRHLITPLSAIGIAAEYQRLDYSPEDTSGHIPFNYYMGKVFYAWTQNARLDYTVSAFGAKYLAGTIDSTSTTAGVTGQMNYNWTPVLQSQISGTYERTHAKETNPNFFDSTTNQWAGSISTTYNAIASQYRISIGRSIIPGANGGLFITDQLQGQYDRDYSERLHFTTAVRLFRDRTVNSPNGNDTRNYVTPFVKVQWMMTRRIFIAGQYSYIWQKYIADANSADANRIALTVGYTGLGRQQR